MAEPTLAAPPPSGQLAQLWSRTYWRVAVFFAGCVVMGAVGGLLWAKTTSLPSYAVRDDLSAGMSELNLAGIVGADVSFTVITGCIGLLIGIAGWLVLHKRGWVVTVVPMLAALGASLMAWRFGIVIGTSGFDERLAAASAGDVVQVDLQLRALSALIVGPFAAVTPIMLLSAFWPEPRIEQVESDIVVTH